jgi:hypothetical protein
MPETMRTPQIAIDTSVAVGVFGHFRSPAVCELGLLPSRSHSYNINERLTDIVRGAVSMLFMHHISSSREFELRMAHLCDHIMTVPTLSS